MTSIDGDTIDAEFDRVVATLPDELAALARTLPALLALPSRHAPRWSHYVTLPPLRDLPWFAAFDQAGSGPPPISPDALDRYRLAHLAGGFHGLLCDRLADGQIVANADLRRLRDALFTHWKEALIAAVGDPPRAAGLISKAMDALRDGLRRERTALRRGHLRPAEYARLVVAKVSWLSAAAIGLIGSRGAPARIIPFHRAFGRLMLGLQLLDDAADEIEDRRLHGISVPDALHQPAAVLIRAAPLVVRHAADDARAGEFGEFARWLDEHSRSIASLSIHSTTVADQADVAGFVRALLKPECPAFSDGYITLNGDVDLPDPNERAVLNRLVTADIRSPDQVPKSFRHLASLGDRHYYSAPASEIAPELRGGLPEFIIRPKRGNPIPGVPATEPPERSGIDSDRLLPCPWPAHGPAPQPAHGPTPQPTADAQLCLDLRAIKEDEDLAPFEALLAWPGGIGSANIRKLFGAAAAGSRIAVVGNRFDGLEKLATSTEWHAVPSVTNLAAKKPGPLQANKELEHGSAVAMVVQKIAPGSQLGLFQFPSTGQYAGIFDVTSAIAASIAWGARVVAVAHSRGIYWGMPAYLRDVLRHAARDGRRAPLVVFSAGDLARGDEHPIIPLDTMAVAPTSVAATGTDDEGRYLRDLRFPSCPIAAGIDLAAPGKTYFADGDAPFHMEDASLACSVVAGVAAVALGRNEGLSMTDLRRVLRLTARAPSRVDVDGTSNAHDPYPEFDAWDHAGHNLKIGHGTVNALAAWLAAGDPICLALMATHSHRLAEGTAPSGYDLALRMAIGWEQFIQGSDSPTSREYQGLRSDLVRFLLRSLELQDALYPLLRHLREIFARRAAHLDWKLWFEDKATCGDESIVAPDHGALVHRIAHVLDTLEDEIASERLSDGQGRLGKWIGVMRDLLVNNTSQQVKNTIARALRPHELWND